MTPIIMTTIICITFYASVFTVCKLGTRHTTMRYAKDLDSPVRGVDSSATELQKILDDEYEKQRAMAFDVAKEIQSIFLDNDQIEEGK